MPLSTTLNSILKNVSTSDNIPKPIKSIFRSLIKAISDTTVNSTTDDVEETEDRVYVTPEMKAFIQNLMDSEPN